jgi:cytochrome c oxidase subunit III
LAEATLGGPAGARAHAGAHEAAPELKHHFVDLEAQREASTLGMWVFLVTEVLFFGGMFTAYVIYRATYRTAFEGASNLLDIKLGAFNTAVLIMSSLTMALAVWASSIGKRKLIIVFLILTILLGGTFLGVKVIEYKDKFDHHLVPGPNFQWDGKFPAAAEQFYSLYFCMTGLHALHMIIGIGIMLVIAAMAWRRHFDSTYFTPVEVSGLYWHFVDIVWIFLFPLLYLIGYHVA